MRQQSRSSRGPDLEERAATVSHWFSTHVREVTIAAIVVVAAGLGVYFWLESREARERNAARALNEAAAAMQAGNVPLATRDLEQLVRRFEGTRSAEDATLILTQLLYDQGRYQEGVARVQALTSSKEPYLAASALNLAGAGLEQLGQHQEAAQRYQQAADRTRFASDRATYMASAARALTAAGNVDEARRIWGRLAEDPSVPQGTAAEARVRLGELNARPAGSRG